MYTALLRFAVLLLAAGCGTGAASAPPTLELGTGERTFEPLGPVINCYMGPQGLFHVYLSLRATGVDPGSADVPPATCDMTTVNPCVAFTVTDVTAGRELDAFVPQRLPLMPSGDGFELDPTRLVMISINSLDEVDGHTFALTASLDQAGVHLTASASAICTPVH
jgi:hypothetical protein